MGRLAWRDLVQDAMARNLWRFKAQPACRFDDGTRLHAELFAAISRDGTDYFAGQFLPAIEQFKMGAEFDKAILDACLPLVPTALRSGAGSQYHGWFSLFRMSS